MNTEEKFAHINQIFTPSAPIDTLEYFVGRDNEIRKIQQAVMERGQHAVMFGGRGVGKTSLANIASELFQNLITIKVTCNHNDSFTSIWIKAIKKIRYMVPVKQIGFSGKESEQMIQLFQIPETGELDTAHIEEAFEGFPDSLLFIFDEFDSVRDSKTKLKMADTIKMLSDNLPQVTVMIVGISDNVNQLIGENPSIERSILQIQMPLMPDAEAAEIIAKLQSAELEIEANIIDKIIEYSSGFPHYIHLLSKFSAYSAIEQGVSLITHTHFDYAVQQSIENSTQSLQSSYDAAISSASRKTQFEDVIIACSMAADIPHRAFSSDEVLEKFNSYTKQNLKKESITYNLGMLCRKERGSVLQKVGGRKQSRYKFRNPLMKAFVKLKLHND